MIFYFSGTGNSLYAAKKIAEYHNETLISISAAINTGNDYYEYSLKDQEKIGFVFPVHAWGPPKKVLDFIGKIKLNHYRGNYIFSVATCGGSIANTMKVMDTCLKKKSLHLNGRFSVIMPNNYILMGDVDSKSRQQKKLTAAENTLKNINKKIDQSAAGEFGLVKGFFPPWLLTGLINPMFQKNAMDTGKFYANDHCSGCGTCEKVCNCNTIHVNGDKPQWGKQCSQCLACIHHCPQKAIQYGKGTEKKGRYTHPQVNIVEMNQ